MPAKFKLLTATKTHLVAILVALATAVIVASPHIRVVQLIGLENFQGVYPVFNDDEITYQARIKEVLEGHLGLGNPYLKEHVNDPFIMPPLAEWTYATVAYVLGTSVPFVTSLMDGVLTFINFLLVYVLFLVITRNNLTLSLLYTTIFFALSFSVMGRPISPQFNALPMFLGLIFIAKLHIEDGETNKRNHFLAGLFSGITTFLYPFFFTTMLAIYGLLGIARVYAEREWPKEIKNFTWFALAYAPFAVLYVYFQIKAASYEFYSETVLRYGLMHTYIPGAFTNVALGFFGFGMVVLACRFLTKREFTFAIASTLSIIILNWQNVITGKSLQFSSHYFFTLLLTLLLSIALLHTVLRRPSAKQISNLTKWSVVGCMMLLLVVLVDLRLREFTQMTQMRYSVDELLELQDKREVFEWFNENTQHDSVVYTLGGEYDYLLPVYTHNKVYYNFYGALYPAAHVETEERWIIQNIFNSEMSTTTILAKQRDFWGNRFIDTYQSAQSRQKIKAMLTGTPYVPGDMVSDEMVSYMYGRWLSFRDKPIPELFSRYELDYILLDKTYPYFNEAKKRIDEEVPAKLTTEIDGSLVYQILSF